MVTLTPEVEVGFDRAEYRIRINRGNNFRRGDILSYIPASDTSLTGLTGQPYFYCLTATAQWFEIGASYIHDGRFRVLQVDTSNTGSQIMAVVQRSGITRNAPVYAIDPSDTPIQGGFNPADVIYGSVSAAESEIGRIQSNEATIRKLYTHYPITGMSTTQGGEYEIFANGETVQVQGATSNTGFVMQTKRSTDGTSLVKLQTIAGSIAANDVLEGATTGATGTAVSYTHLTLPTKA